MNNYIVPKKLVFFIISLLALGCSNPEVLIHGYTEKERISIYHDAELANEKAVKDAESYYPYQLEDEQSKGKWNSNKMQFDSLYNAAIANFLSKKDQLKKQYITEIANKYKLSYEYIDTLFVEGVNK